MTAVGEADTMKLVALAVMLTCYFVHTYCDECSVDEIQTIQQQWTSTFSNNAVRLFEFGVAFFLRLALLHKFVTVIIVVIERHKSPCLVLVVGSLKPFLRQSHFSASV